MQRLQKNAQKQDSFQCKMRFATLAKNAQNNDSYPECKLSFATLAKNTQNKRKNGFYNFSRIPNHDCSFISGCFPHPQAWKDASSAPIWRNGAYGRGDHRACESTPRRG
jgi:hypothetical protein